MKFTRIHKCTIIAVIIILLHYTLTQVYYQNYSNELYAEYYIVSDSVVKYIGNGTGDPVEIPDVLYGDVIQLTGYRDLGVNASSSRLNFLMAPMFCVDRVVVATHLAIGDNQDASISRLVDYIKNQNGNIRSWVLNALDGRLVIAGSGNNISHIFSNNSYLWFSIIFNYIAVNSYLYLVIISIVYLLRVIENRYISTSNK